VTRGLLAHMQSEAQLVTVAHLSLERMPYRVEFVNLRRNPVTTTTESDFAYLCRHSRSTNFAGATFVTSNAEQ